MQDLGGSLRFWVERLSPRKGFLGDPYKIRLLNGFYRVRVRFGDVGGWTFAGS